MREEELRAVVAVNIGRYRKLNGQTQAELAEKLSYSDKSVSKWERGEGMPDVFVLSQIAELYGITVNDLLSDRAPEPKAPTRVLVVSLSIGLVFLVTAIVFFALRMVIPSMERAWIAFVFALPVSFIVLIVFSALWWGYAVQAVAVSGLVWALALCIHMVTGRAEVENIYLVAAVLQVLCILWFLLKRHQKNARRK